MSTEFEALYNKITTYAQEVTDYKFTTDQDVSNLKALFEKIHQFIAASNVSTSGKESILLSLRNAIIQVDLVGTDFSYLTYDVARMLRAFIKQVSVSIELTQAIPQ